jgi:hypothetical protein
LDLGVAGPPGSEPLPITSSQMTHLWDGLCAAYRILGFESATKGDNVFRELVLARIIEPTSKIDTERVLSEVGVAAASYATVKRRLPSYAQPSWRQSLAAASARHARLGPASLVLFDVSTLYFETDAGDGFREPGLSKERRLEPQITLGLLTDASGFPLTVEAFEGNRAAAVKRNRFIKLTGATKTVNRELEAKTRALAGWKGYTTNLTGQPADFVIDAYHQLWRIEKSFRMSKHDLQARPIYHHIRESIEAHLSIVVAAMAVSHWIEVQTSWSIKKFVRTARRYRTVRIKAGGQTLTAADPLPNDLREALIKISANGEVCLT